MLLFNWGMFLDLSSHWERADNYHVTNQNQLNLNCIQSKCHQVLSEMFCEKHCLYPSELS